LTLERRELQGAGRWSGAKDQSAWATANGIRTGTALAEVEKLNGKGVQAVGLRLGLFAAGVDRLAGAARWQSREPGGCIIGVEFVPPGGCAG